MPNFLLAMYPIEAHNFRYLNIWDLPGLRPNPPDEAHNVDPNARGGDSPGQIDPLPRDEGKK